MAAAHTVAVQCTTVKINNKSAGPHTTAFTTYFMEVVVTIIDFLMVIGLNRAYSQGELRVHVSKANDEPIKKVINDNGS